MDGEVVEAEKVVVAMGPWSNLAAAWLPLPMAVSGHKYHSAILENPAGVEVRRPRRPLQALAIPLLLLQSAPVLYRHVSFLVQLLFSPFKVPLLSFYSLSSVLLQAAVHVTALLPGGAHRKVTMLWSSGG